MKKQLSVQDYLDWNSRLNTQRQYWVNQWQLVSEYIHQRRADFTSSKQAGAFISSEIWWDDPVHIAETASSAFLGYVWSAGVHSFRLKPNPKVFGKDKTMSQWWAQTTDTLQAEMDDKEAGLSTSMDESTLDLITLGTDAIFTEERNQDRPELGCLSFQPWSVLEFAAGENAGGSATIFGREREYSVAQLVERYKIDNVSQKVRDLYAKGSRDEKIKVLQFIHPREEGMREVSSKAAKDMPIASVHIEIDTKHMIKESGYPELPVACARLAKRLNETYGRGRGMNALPSILMGNQVMEDYTLALEKNLDPPMYQLNDAVSGNGFIDTSAGAINILRLDKANPTANPTGKLFDIQDIRTAPEMLERLENSVSNHFMIDRLINLNNDVEMTRGEAFLRNSIRQSTLRNPVSRLLIEKFNPTIDTSFAICLRRNKFGYMPGDPNAAAREKQGFNVEYLPEKVIAAMEAGEELYTIEYLTPAARDLMAEEGQGMKETLGIAAEMAVIDETIKHRIDTEWTLSRFAEIKGADQKMFKKKADVEKAIMKEQEMRQQAQQLQLQQQQAGVAKDAAIAQNNIQN